MSQENTTKFSERFGYKQPKGLQVDDFDTETRIRLINVFDEVIRVYSGEHLSAHGLQHIWDSHYKRLRAEYTFARFKTETQVLIAKQSWHEVLTILELVFQALRRVDHGYRWQQRQNSLHSYCNSVLTEEGVPWRLADNAFIPLADKEGLEAITTALSGETDDVVKHLRAAAAHLRGRPPRFSKSVAESVSALEVVSRDIADSDKGFGEVWKTVVRKLDLNGGVSRQIQALWGWASNLDDGRHASKKKPASNEVAAAEDAVYALVTVSAAINLLRAKLKLAPKS